jgi:hypothetical protein
MSSLGETTTISWSGTITLIILWGIGPLIYLGIYIVNLFKRKYNKGGSIEEEEAEESAVVVKKTTGDDDDEDADNTTTTRTVAVSEHEGEVVQNWTSTQYLFSLIGYAIGIGNVWRFCYIIAQDGGSASLFGKYKVVRCMRVSLYSIFLSLSLSLYIYIYIYISLLITFLLYFPLESKIT